MTPKAPDLPIIEPPPTPPPTPPTLQTAGGLSFKDAAPMICGVVDNGVCADDPRVLVRVNEATKMILDLMIPVGGMATYDIQAYQFNNQGDPLVLLPPQLENVIEAFPTEPNTRVRNQTDIAQGWYEIVNQSVYLDPGQYNDNPLIDLGLVADVTAPSTLRRLYSYPGLSPVNSIVRVTGAKRYVPLQSDQDYLIVQNIEALKLMILCIERRENAAPEEGDKYQKAATDLLQAEVKKHILDPRNYMRRVSAYYDDIANFPENTFGWMRANIAIDVEMAVKTGKEHLSWVLNQVERRIINAGKYKDCVIQLQANVVGGMVYLPIYVGAVLAVDLDGCPIQIRSQFFQHLENGPGMYSCSQTLIDQGDEYFPGSESLRRKYKLVADCVNTVCLNAVCKVRWLEKKPGDLMVIKNYEALRLMVAAKMLEEKEDWKNAQANLQLALKLLDDEIKEYLAGIEHTVHVQMDGFGLGDVGGYWNQ